MKDSQAPSLTFLPEDIQELGDFWSQEYDECPKNIKKLWKNRENYLNKLNKRGYESVYLKLNEWANKKNRSRSSSLSSTSSNESYSNNCSLFKDSIRKDGLTYADIVKSTC